MQSVSSKIKRGDKKIVFVLSLLSHESEKHSTSHKKEIDNLFLVLNTQEMRIF